jgi:hypothetical protein
VPWKVISAADAASKDGLTIYWLPASQQELEKSSLRFSRTLSSYASQCVSMGIVDFHSPMGQKYLAQSKAPVVVLATADGSPVGKLESTNGFLKVQDVEKLVNGEIKKRESFGVRPKVHVPQQGQRCGQRT